MLTKKIVMVSLLIFPMMCIGKTFPTNYISPSNMNWQNTPLSTQISECKDFKEWISLVSDEVAYSVRWAKTSISHENSNEIIIQNLVPSSGGLNTGIFRIMKNTCAKITDWVGGFVIYPIPSRDHHIVIYNKIGLEYSRTELQYKNGKYFQKSKTEIPIELTRLNNSPIDFNQFFNFINYGASKK